MGAEKKTMKELAVASYLQFTLVLYLFESVHLSHLLPYTLVEGLCGKMFFK